MWSLLVPLLLVINRSDVPAGFEAGATVERSVLVAEHERPYRVHVPRGWTGPVPVVLVFRK